MNRYLIEIAAEMQVYESVSELSRTVKYYVRAETQEEAERLALLHDSKNYGENRIIIFSAIEL